MRRTLATLAISGALGAVLLAGPATASADVKPVMTHNSNDGTTLVLADPPGMTHNSPDMTHNLCRC